MASPSFPMECLEKIPGFKAILKAVIKSQILALVNQLADQTGEQVVILTADVNQRTFTQFGSSDSTDFLAERDDVHSDFLKHCIKKFNLRHHTNGSKDLPEEESNDTEKEAITKSTKQNKWRRAQTEVSTRTKAAMARKSAAEVNAGDTTHEDTVDTIVLSEGEPSCKKKRRTQDKTGKYDESCPIDKDDEECRKVKTDGGTSGLTETKDNVLTVENSESQETGQKDKGTDDSVRDNVGDDIDNDDTEDDKDDFDSLSRNRLTEDSATVLTTGNNKVLKLTKTGRRFVSGQALNEDMRTSLVLQVVQQGGDVKTGYVPRGVFTQVSKQLGVNTSSVSRIWERYVSDGTITPRQTSRNEKM